MTRPELAAAIRDLADDEKLELWDSLDHDAPTPQWHEEVLDERLDHADAASFTSWSEAKARILGSR